MCLKILLKMITTCLHSAILPSTRSVLWNFKVFHKHYIFRKIDSNPINSISVWSLLEIIYFFPTWPHILPVLCYSQILHPLFLEIWSVVVLHITLWYSTFERLTLFVLQLKIVVVNIWIDKQNSSSHIIYQYRSLTKIIVLLLWLHLFPNKYFGFTVTVTVECINYLLFNDLFSNGY